MLEHLDIGTYVPTLVDKKSTSVYCSIYKTQASYLFIDVFVAHHVIKTGQTEKILYTESLKYTIINSVKYFTILR